MNSSDLPAAARSAVRVVAALTPRERDVFLKDALARDPALAGRFHFASESDLTPENWSHRLEVWQPEILLTGWSTPPLPVAWAAHPQCPLRYVCHVTGSVRQLVPRGFLERGGVVSNWGESISPLVAEHGLLLVLAALRNLTAWPGFIARPSSSRQLTDLRTRTLFGLRVGLHGFGSIARALIPLLRPFGVSLLAYSDGVPDSLFAQHGVERAESLPALFAQSQVLIECEALTPHTRGMVNAALLAALPDDAVFVNIGRGAVVDEDALLREATSERLRVALDVCATEPPTTESPSAQCPRVLLSPHIAGPTADRYADCGHHALANVSRYLRGLPVEGALTLAAYDRAT